jgi:uncharacterized membrane protein YeaQ/YmgE (transglycosylase-associated protein family)
MPGHGIIGTIIIGFIVGVIAKFLMPGKDPTGFIWTVIIGIAGAWIAEFLGETVFHWYRDPGTGPGIIASIIGAMILLFVYHLIRRNSNST